MPARAAAGLVVAGGIAFAARRAGSLSTAGAIAATLVGAAAVAAGWEWGALLVLYFVTSSLLSRLGADEKARRSGAVVEKGGARDAVQVLANGGLFAVCVLAASITDYRTTAPLAIAALGALGASAADTWATEVGVLFGGIPRSLRTLRRCPPGTSGAVSLVGTLAMIAGALFVGVTARALGLSDAVGVVTVGGTAGAIADSLLGATLQERRWCDACSLPTERHLHDCGTATRVAGGQPWIDNDAVNLVATLIGAAVAATLASL